MGSVCMTRSPSDSQSISAQSIQEWLVNHIADSIELDPTSLDVKADFTDYGLNSAEMVNVSGELETYLGRTLDPTMVLDYPNISTLSEYLANLPPQEAQVAVTDANNDENPQALLANLDQMSDDEVEGLLESLLSEKS